MMTQISHVCSWKQIKALKEELLFIKNHEEEVNGTQKQIANSGLTTELGPQSQDLSKIMADIQAQYDELASTGLSRLRRTPQWPPCRALR